MAVPGGLVGTLFSAKLGMVSLLVGALAFYFRLVWDDLKTVEGGKNAEGVLAAIRYHSLSFTLLYGTTAIVLLSAFVDLASILYASPGLGVVSPGFFLTGLGSAFAFVLSFYGRALSELETLRKAASRPSGSAIEAHRGAGDSQKPAR